jgi:hypothetical protein
VNRRTLLAALFLLALGGLVLHLRIHYFMVSEKVDPSAAGFDITLFFASAFPFLDLILVTALFMSRKTAVYGYLLNGLIVIYGTVFMTHFSIAASVATSAPPVDWVLKSTLPDIAIAWADFFVGKSLYNAYLWTPRVETFNNT